MRPILLLALVALPVAGACTHGTRVATLGPATAPEGFHAWYRTKGDTVHHFGELFAVDRSALLIRTDRIRRIPWERLEYLNVDKVGNLFDVKVNQRPDSAKVERLRLSSRFPQGLSGPLLAQVLATLKQDAVEELP
jgi:hypothetical protein